MENRLVQLDMMRGLAALLVCAGHLRGFIFVDFPQLESPTLLDKAFYFITGFGHQSVVVFFVLSGFLVGGSVVNSCAAGRWSWKKYTLRRLTRLWVVLLPALMLTWGWDILGRHLGGASGYTGAFSAQLSSGPTAGGPAIWDGVALWGNILFLQTVSVPVFGSNGPLWSLANEFWYYVLFPLAYAGWVIREQRVVCWLLCLAAAAVLPGGLLLAGLIWLFGCGAYWAMQQPEVLQFCRHPAVVGIMLLACGASGVASRAGHWFGNDFILGATFAGLVPALAGWNGGPAGYRSTAYRLSDISYTLYLSHFPFLACGFFVGLAPVQLRPDGPGLLVFTALLAAALAQAVVLWWLFERNTDVVRRWVEDRGIKRAQG